MAPGGAALGTSVAEHHIIFTGGVASGPLSSQGDPIMFETLFRYSRVLARHLDGPAAEERDCFVAHFAASGATRDSVANLASEILVVAGRLDVSGTRAVAPEEVASVADRWVRHHRRRGHSISPGRRQRFVQVATDWLRFMGRLQFPPPKAGGDSDLVDEFAMHMQRERGLSPITINNCCWHVRSFLTWLAEQRSGAEDATLEQVDAFLSMRGAQGWCRASIATAATALRSFYAHMAATGRCAESFVAGIEGPRLFRQEALPAGPCWDDVQRLIASTDTDRPRDIRDRDRHAHRVRRSQHDGFDAEESLRRYFVVALH